MSPLSAAPASFARVPSYAARVCRDFRTDVCDCEGADTAVASCATVVAEVRTPAVLIFAAFGAALVVAGGVVAAQLSFARCGKR
jgi:hypothetical protein